VNARLLRLWDSLRASYWFVPSVMTLGAVGAAQGALVLDRLLLADGGGMVTWLHAAGEPEGARLLLSTVAGSMITVAGVTFSILVVALSLASSQFGPRLLRGFLRDRANQVVLGTFISTFVYCLLVIRNVPMGVEGSVAAVPQVSVAVALLLGLAGVAVLIYFIHHAATSIQASHVIEMAGAELDEAIRQTFPALDQEEGSRAALVPADALPDGFEEEAATVEAGASGYVQEIDTEGLVALAGEREAVVELLHGRGSFVVEGGPLARVAPAAAADEEVGEAIRSALVLAAGRVSSRDVERGVSQLAEVAVRALSPGINDPFTAGQVLDRLGQSLALLGERKLPTPCFHEDGVLRLVVPIPSVPDLLHLAFDQIRHYGKGDPRVPVDLLETLTRVAVKARHRGLRRELLRQAERVRSSAAATLGEDDLERVEAAFETARAILTGERGAASPQNAGRNAASGPGPPRRAQG